MRTHYWSALQIKEKFCGIFSAFKNGLLVLSGENGFGSEKRSVSSGENGSGPEKDQYRLERPQADHSSLVFVN